MGPRARSCRAAAQARAAGRASNHDSRGDRAERGGACGGSIRRASTVSGPGRWELTGGGVLIGGYELGERSAELTPNTGSSSFDEFTTDNTVKPAFGLQARIGFVVTPALTVEGGFRFARPVYEVRVSEDIENAPDTTVEETLSQYLFDGSVVWHVTRAGFGRRPGSAVPVRGRWLLARAARRGRVRRGRSGVSRRGRHQVVVRAGPSAESACAVKPASRSATVGSTSRMANASCRQPAGSCSTPSRPSNSVGLKRATATSR